MSYRGLRMPALPTERLGDVHLATARPSKPRCELLKHPANPTTLQLQLILISSDGLGHMNTMQNPSWVTCVTCSSCGISVIESVLVQCNTVPPVQPQAMEVVSACYILQAAACAGLVFFNLPQDGAHAQEHLALLFFVLLLYQLLPFCYVSVGSSCLQCWHTYKHQHASLTPHTAQQVYSGTFGSVAYCCIAWPTPAMSLQDPFECVGGSSILLTPCWMQMSFFVADRRFYAADVANGLYSPSAYYAATIVSSKRHQHHCRHQGPRGVKTHARQRCLPSAACHLVKSVPSSTSMCPSTRTCLLQRTPPCCGRKPVADP